MKYLYLISSELTNEVISYLFRNTLTKNKFKIHVFT